ncbi:MAG: SPOR domain-containing protein [Gammaproteobacteria bacterium]
MTKDYKHRTSRRPRYARKGFPIWRWLLAALLIGLFAGFLWFLRSPEPPTPAKAKLLKIPRPIKEEPAPKAAKTPKESPKPEPEKTRFEFYTILPEQELEIPETEIKIRKSEEKKGRAQPGSYTLQVGSFRKFQDADRLKAELAMQGIHSTIETAKIGGTAWNRVKIGPFKSMTAVDVVRRRLKLQHIDAVVVGAK